MGAKSPPKIAAVRKAAAGIAAVDQCRHMLTCFTLADRDGGGP